MSLTQHFVFASNWPQDWGPAPSESIVLEILMSSRMSSENIRKRFQDANLSLLEWQCNGRGRAQFKMGLILRGGSSRGLTNTNIIETKMLSNTNTKSFGV